MVVLAWIALVICCIALSWKLFIFLEDRYYYNKGRREAWQEREKEVAALAKELEELEKELGQLKKK
tara:strand:- start:251 stop:448 length:198 start_codon:yes stop_codon:yes gene_type:complete